MSDDFMFVSEWYPREASAAAFTVESAGGVRVRIETKDRGDPGAEAGTTVAEFGASGPGIQRVAVDDLGDLYRMRVLRLSQDPNCCRIRLFRPIWFRKDGDAPPPNTPPPGPATPAT